MKENMVNSTNGHKFERELCQKLSEKGFWAHNIASRSEGQPADVIAAKNNTVILIDCKVCENDEFSFSRIEPNQETAMTLFDKCGNDLSYFALKMSNGDIYMLSFAAIQFFQGKGRLRKQAIELLETFEDWVEWIDR